MARKRAAKAKNTPRHEYYVYQPTRIVDAKTGVARPFASTPASTKPIGRPREIEWRLICAEIAWRIVQKTAPRVRTKFRDQMLEWCLRTYHREAAASAMLEAINVMCDRFNYGRKP
jgi:hypothetical protein